MKLELVESKKLYELGSASGVAKYKEGFYVIGDNSPFLFHYNLDFELIDKHLIYEIESNAEPIIHKSHKPDFETLELINETTLLILGSGSVSPYRNIGYLVDVENDFLSVRLDLTAFYKVLKSLPIMAEVELSLEAIAYNSGQLYIFNRSNNCIFSVDYSTWLSFVKNGGDVPKIVSKHYNLPSKNGVTARFSGATFHTTSNVLLFTASVEATNNAYDDGAVLGSFVGCVALNNGELSEELQCVQIENTNPLKIEGITIISAAKQNECTLCLVSDNDGEYSEMIEVILSNY